MFMYYNFVWLIAKLEKQTHPWGVQSSKMVSTSRNLITVYFFFFFKFINTT